MIKLMHGRGQLGAALKDLVEKEKPDLEAIIYHSGNFLNKDENLQRKYYEDFKKFVNDNPKSKIIFVSTTSEADNPYVFYKRKAEEYLLNKNKNGSVIRFASIIGKGICQRLREEEIDAYGELDLISLEDAAKEIIKFSALNPEEKIYRVRGALVPAKTAKDLILYGRDGNKY